LWFYGGASGLWFFFFFFANKFAVFISAQQAIASHKPTRKRPMG